MSHPAFPTAEELATGAPVFVPVNPIEYHGPHLSLRNDHLVSSGLMRDVYGLLAAARPEWPFLEVPDLNMGCGVAPGPGAETHSFRAVRARVLEVCRALAAQGAQRVVLHSFHGEPLHNLAIEAGVQWLRERGVPAFAPMHLILRTIVNLPLERLAEVLETIPDPAERAAVRAVFRVDFHAGFGETSLALHYAPDSVAPNLGEIPPCPPLRPNAVLQILARVVRRLGAEAAGDELAYLANVVAWVNLKPFPGYTGRPHAATAAAGRALAALIVPPLAEAALAVLEGREAPPTPAMGWLGTLTLDGRLLEALRLH
jgi:creatinine amidohydrolase